MRPSNLTSTGQSIAWYTRHAPDAAALIEDGSPITWRTLAADLVHCVRALKATAIGPGSLVGLQISRRYQHLLLLLGCELAGAAATTLGAEDFSDPDAVMRHCDLVLTDEPTDFTGPPKMIVIPPDWLARLKLSPVRTEHLSLLEREIEPDQVVRIVRTSGTTGRPKAMPMTHATQQLRVVRTAGRFAHHILSNPRMLCPYGLSIGTVYVRVLLCLQHGGTVFFAAGSQIDDLIAAGVVNFGTLSLGDAEGVVQRAGTPRAGPKMQLEVFGATVAPALRQQIRERLNADLTNKYASNETNPIAVIGDDNIGTLYPGVELRIVDEAGRDVPDGETGLVRVKTETMVHGYFNDPARTEASFIDGWYQTADVGRIPAPGRVVLLGRADDMLNIGGVKIAPAGFEARLKLIDGISDAVVISVMNENAVGILLVAAEHEQDDPTARLKARIVEVATDYSPRFEIMMSRRFPRTDTGKVRRHEVEAEYRQSLSVASRVTAR
jgi:acyl-coenzyme A synthetase/AMP-(fatty) acid ligase